MSSDDEELAQLRRARNSRPGAMSKVSCHEVSVCAHVYSVCNLAVRCIVHETYFKHMWYF